ncbi:unnamed protein product [Mytilus coruscus]|uniref:BPTI/Kunitz inhibitor domain-containing protein n=1 Tax=Mytilus coruscus TaxID=42192 RepID=A0A6J7ZZ29_MYTCO|nr:unnamed protein product [Mytilus coruscus]
MWSALVVVFCVIGSVQAIISDCRLPKQKGLCKARIPRFYFDYYSKQCRNFIYGGCGGNENNFKSLNECQDKCIVKPKPERCLTCCGPPPCCSTCITKTKPGFCPLVPQDTVGICVEECSSDYGCPDNKKCCSNGCGHVCSFPKGGIKPQPATCKIGKPLPNIFCGRGPSRQECPKKYYCNIDPVDRFAVCCRRSYNYL